MRANKPLQQILVATRSYWDRPEFRPAVRENFAKVIDCGTAALGGEVFASESEERIVFHTCKSRSCPSCGWRATLLWQRDQWSALPDIPYTGLCFTMPNVLWPIFRQNRRLLHDLPALAASVIQQFAQANHQAKATVLVMPHTFGRHLNFNVHLHIMVSTGGLSESDGRWIKSLGFDRERLMRMWRYAVITYLRAALKTGLITANETALELREILTTQYERWWNVHLDPIRSKWHFLGYVSRYVRRPPIAQHRFTKITNEEVEFSTKDTRLKQIVTTRYSSLNFVDALSDHVPDRYNHAIRRFGLLAPRTVNKTSDAVFAILGQKQQPRPRRLNWRSSIRKYFRVDPLIDGRGQTMQWVRRTKPLGK